MVHCHGSTSEHAGRRLVILLKSTCYAVKGVVMVTDHFATPANVLEALKVAIRENLVYVSVKLAVTDVWACSYPHCYIRKAPGLAFPSALH